MTGRERYGPLFALYFGPMLVGQLAVCVASIAVARRLTGLRKLEFQFIALALGYLNLVAVAVEICYAMWPPPWLHSVTRVVSYLVYVAFGISAWSVTSHRVYPLCLDYDRAVAGGRMRNPTLRNRANPSGATAARSRRGFTHKGD